MSAARSAEEYCHRHQFGALHLSEERLRLAERAQNELIVLPDRKSSAVVGEPQCGARDLNQLLFLTNNAGATVRELVTNCARRNGIEDALGRSVNFFHQDCLSSEVRLNVDLDTVLTLLANGCYRWLASQLHGFDLGKPKCVCRKFVEKSGAVEFEVGHRIVVYLDRRSHKPILREANLDKHHPKIPWLVNRRLEFQFS